MRAFFTSASLLSLVLIFQGVSAEIGQMKVTKGWNTGFKANVHVLLQKDVTDGWLITFRFSKPILKIESWIGDVLTYSPDKKIYVIANKPHLKNLQAGSRLEGVFVLQKAIPNTPAPTASVELRRRGMGQGGEGGGTAAPITQVPVTSAPGPYNYKDVLHKSILFYEAQRSGKLPVDNRVPWRGDSALQDRGQNGEDLTGGWYDAGDFVKFGFPMAYSVTMLAWGLVNYRSAYETSGELEYMLDSIKWPLDFLIKAHTKTFELYGQVGDGDADHSSWGRPEDLNMPRPAYKITAQKPGTDLAAETAAAMAASAIAFKKTNLQYAQLLIRHAEELFQFAEKYRGIYSNSIPKAAKFYKSSGGKDELVWAAAWIYRATNNKAYLTKAENMYRVFSIGNKPWSFSWDDKRAGVQLMLAELTKKPIYVQAIQRFLNGWLPRRSVKYTPRGLAWRDKWGPNRYAANTAFLALVAADIGITPVIYRSFAKKQIHYMLGDGGRSFVVGVGKNPPQRPHHRSSSCPSRPAPCNWSNFNNPGPNPKVLYGALVGGPNQYDKYTDSRKDHVANEVATDYNAGFQSAVAGLKSLQLRGI